MAAAIIIELLLGLINIAIAIVLFLITHFDFTNSILFSGLIQMLLVHKDISANYRWGIFIGIFIICLIFQNAFKVGRIIFAIFSIIVFGILGAIWCEYDTKLAQYMAMGLWMIVAGFFNYFSWIIMREKERMS